MCFAENQIVEDVLTLYRRLRNSLRSSTEWGEMSENGLWQELCLCILSSNVPYELAQSAFYHLKEKGYLRLGWLTATPNSQKIVAKELSKSIYLPKKLDGSHRKYRFPNSRARDICQASEVVSTYKDWLSKLLGASWSETKVRDFLVSNIPGLGLKEASHFLRNIGYSDHLAIIDSHVLSFLRETKLIPQANTKTINRKTYLEIESQLREICSEYGLNLSIFDMAIWQYMRRR